MKKYFISFLVLFFACTAAAGTLEDYKVASKLAKAAIAKDDMETARSYTIQAGTLALQLGKAGWASWRYNNFGYYVYLKWLAAINYDERIEMLPMVYPKHRDKYKRALKADMKKHVKLLEDARSYLRMALTLENSKVMHARQKDNKRLATIQNNLKQVEEYLAYVKDDTRL